MYEIIKVILLFNAFILHMRKLKPRKVNALIYNHTFSHWQRQTFENIGLQLMRKLRNIDADMNLEP